VTTLGSAKEPTELCPVNIADGERENDYDYCVLTLDPNDMVLVHRECCVGLRRVGLILNFSLCQASEQDQLSHDEMG
jgi:hypothetical protein